jgi:hypothetical protein
MIWLAIYLMLGLWTALTVAILFFAKNEVPDAREEAGILGWLTFATFLWPIAWVTLFGWVLGGMLAEKPRRPRK